MGWRVRPSLASGGRRDKTSQPASSRTEFRSRRLEAVRKVWAMASSPTPSSPPDTSRPCPCGSGKLFADCCGPVLAGRRMAATAEEQMRARFTAHVVHDFAFLHRTYLPTSRQPFVEVTEKPATVWTRLVVHHHDPGPTPDLASVDFSAYGTEEGREMVLHEKAEFARSESGWIYTRSLREGPAPFKASSPKPGRNEPCPCGSGKKYKQCCLLKA
jgi:SEC-C motif-containing protein